MSSSRACGETGCGGCPTVGQVSAWMARAREEGKRNANLALGLPEFFNVDAATLEGGEG